MKVTRIIAASIVAATMIAGAGAASAATRTIDIYGASAQFNLWTAVAPSFLDTTAACHNQAGVANSSNSNTAVSNYGTFHGYNCTNYGGDDIIIRVASKASYDGVWALKGVCDPEQRGTHYVAGTNCTTAPDVGASGGNNESQGLLSCANANQRYFVADWSANTIACETVNIGATDVDANYIIQTSHGNKTGWNQAGGWIDRVFTDKPPYFGYTGIANASIEPVIDPSGLDFANPVVVPFSFFVNKLVTTTKCDGGLRAGEICTNASLDAHNNSYDCPLTMPNFTTGAAGTFTTCGAASGAASTITNVSRLQAELIYTSQIYDWTDFSEAYPASLMAIACARHAGSGSRANFSLDVLGKWLAGAEINTESNIATGGPFDFFQDGTGDELNCVNGPTAAANFYYNYRSSWGGIGYADADNKENTTAGTQTLKYANILPVMYNGVWPTRVNIRDGIYDDFWGAQFSYMNSADYQRNEVQDLITFASDPVKITGLPSNRGLYYATSAEMNVTKADPSQYPTLLQPATSSPYTP